MNAGRLAASLVVTHTVTATVAWINGWLTGRWHQDKVANRLDDADTIDLRDLFDPARPYDWSVDGECDRSVR